MLGLDRVWRGVSRRGLAPNSALSVAFALDARSSARGIRVFDGPTGSAALAQLGGLFEDLVAEEVVVGEAGVALAAVSLPFSAISLTLLMPSRLASNRMPSSM